MACDARTRDDQAVLIAKCVDARSHLFVYTQYRLGVRQLEIFATAGTESWSNTARTARTWTSSQLAPFRKPVVFASDANVFHVWDGYLFQLPPLLKRRVLQDPAVFVGHAEFVKDVVVVNLDLGIANFFELFLVLSDGEKCADLEVVDI